MKIYFIKNGNMDINVFSDMFTFPNKDYILSLYDTDREKFEVEVDKIKTKISVTNK